MKSWFAFLIVALVQTSLAFGGEGDPLEDCSYFDELVSYFREDGAKPPQRIVQPAAGLASSESPVVQSVSGSAFLESPIFVHNYPNIAGSLKRILSAQPGRRETLAKSKGIGYLILEVPMSEILEALSSNLLKPQVRWFKLVPAKPNLREWRSKPGTIAFLFDTSVLDLPGAFSDAVVVENFMAYASVRKTSLTPELVLGNVADCASSDQWRNTGYYRTEGLLPLWDMRGAIGLEPLLLFEGRLREKRVPIFGALPGAEDIERNRYQGAVVVSHTPTAFEQYGLVDPPSKEEVEALFVPQRIASFRSGSGDRNIISPAFWLQFAKSRIGVVTSRGFTIRGKFVDFGINAHMRNEPYLRILAEDKTIRYVAFSDIENFDLEYVPNLSNPLGVGVLRAKLFDPEFVTRFEYLQKNTAAQTLVIIP